MSSFAKQMLSKKGMLFNMAADGLQLSMAPAYHINKHKKALDFVRACMEVPFQEAFILKPSF